MKLELSTWGRVMLISAIGQLRGNIMLVRKSMKILDTLELSDQEKEEVGFKTTPAGAFWQDAGHLFPLEFSEDDLELMKRAAKEYQEWPAGQGALVVELCKRLGIDDDRVGGPR